MFWETQWPTLKQDLFYETINFVTVGKVTLGWEKNVDRNGMGHNALLTLNMILALQLSTPCFESQ